MKYWIEVTENREGSDCRFTAEIGTLSQGSTFGGWRCEQGPQGMTREETFAAAAALVQGWLADQDANEAIAKKEYDVWGGYPEQDCGEHFATFDTLEDAAKYRVETLLHARKGLWLSIRERRV